MEKPIKTFENYEEFECYVRLLHISKPMQDEILQHERAHHETATRLGYNSKYAIEEKVSGSGLKKYRGSLIFDEEVTNPEHIRLILSAPIDPSPEDLEGIANSC
jgi:hypothetical protein